MDIQSQYVATSNQADNYKPPPTSTAKQSGIDFVVRYTGIKYRKNEVEFEIMCRRPPWSSMAVNSLQYWPALTSKLSLAPYFIKVLAVITDRLQLPLTMSVSSHRINIMSMMIIMMEDWGEQMSIRFNTALLCYEPDSPYTPSGSSSLNTRLCIPNILMLNYLLSYITYSNYTIFRQGKPIKITQNNTEQKYHTQASGLNWAFLYWSAEPLIILSFLLYFWLSENWSGPEYYLRYFLVPVPCAILLTSCFYLFSMPNFNIINTLLLCKNLCNFLLVKQYGSDCFSWCWDCYCWCICVCVWWGWFGGLLSQFFPQHYLLTLINYVCNFKNQNLFSSFASMNLEERIEEQEEAQRYLEQKNVYEIMQSMIEDLLMHQPEDPLSHMISHLGQPDRKIIFLIGPPGLRLYKIAESALNSNSQNQFIAFNSGQFVSSNKKSFNPQAQKLFQQSRLIPDSLIQDKILQQTVAFCKKNSHAIIEGFPKTLSQAIAFQKKGSYPDKIIFVNVDKDKLFELCLKKLKAHGQGRPEQELKEDAQKAANQHYMNIKDLKKYYPSYLQINASNESDEQISKDISKCLGLNFGQLQPRKNTRIVVVGSPYSGRTTLGKSIASKYNLIYVSTAVLIAQQIRRGTVTGRKIKQKYAANQIIDNFTVEKLLEERISKKDCEMQGYVIEGYPKNKQQLENLKNLHIHPNFIIGINPSEQTILRRLGKNQTEQFQRRYSKWKQFYQALEEDSKVFWVNPQFDSQNAFEEVCFEIENRKL